MIKKLLSIQQSNIPKIGLRGSVVFYILLHLRLAVLAPHIHSLFDPSLQSAPDYTLVP